MLAPHRDVIEVLAATASDPPDVEIVDASGPGAELPAAVGPDAPPLLVLVGSEPPPALLEHALDRRVGGLVAISEPGEVLAEALVKVASGSVVLSRSGESPSRSGPDGLGRWPGEDRGLSRRESQVLVHIATGRSPEEVAAALGIAHETVRSHLKRLYHKLGVRDRATAVARAWTEGIVDHRTIGEGRWR
jgi:DNA-binding NarL/FixJ family response regulator